MLIRSFRVRFLLWNVLLTGAVLAGFGVLTLGLSYRKGLARLDSDLRENARREFRKAHLSDFRGGMDPVWRSEYGGGPEQVPMALMIRERGGSRIRLQTQAWPEELQETEFSDPPLKPGDYRLPPPRDRFEDSPNRRPLRGGEERGRPPRRFDKPPPMREGGGAPLWKAGQFTSIKLFDGRWRFGVIGQRDVTVILGVPLQPLQIQTRRLARVLLISFLPGLLLIAISGWILTGRAMRPVQALTKTAEGITARGLDQRLPLTRESKEFNRLSEVFNSMMDRLEKSFQQATRFSADAAHELKTPLAILQGQLEESLREADDNPVQQRLCAGLLEEVQRLKGIVRKLLLLSLADAGELRIQRKAVDLTSLVKNAVEDIGILAPEVKVDLLASAPAVLQGDSDLLAQVVQNLVGNAVKYNAADGTIRLEIETRPNNIHLVVTNGGSPVPPEVQSRLFERFYRGDASRNRAVEGTGLGLSLSREIARAHGGDLILKQSDEDGTTFVLSLPL